VVLGAQLGVAPPLLRGRIDENRMVRCLFGRSGCQCQFRQVELASKGKGEGQGRVKGGSKEGQRKGRMRGEDRQVQG
jgi:hypothetical protein